MGHTTRKYLQFLFISGVFLIFVFGNLLSDLWFDEIITLTDFMWGPQGHSLADVFRRYPVANNHMLFSAVGFFWTHTISEFGTEWVLRIPPLVFSLLLLMRVYFSWSKDLGEKSALYCATLIAVSPVFCNFAWQLRGYSLSMLLSAVAVDSLNSWRKNLSWKSGLQLGIACFLLPIAMPSNVLIVGVFILFYLCKTITDGKKKTWWVAPALPAATGLLGCAPYFLIFDQFRKVMDQTGGWASRTDVIAAWILALAVHLGMIVILAAVSGKGKWNLKNGGLLFGCSFVSLLAVPLIMSPSPFPRALLSFLPVLTFSFVLMIKERLNALRIKPFHAATILFIWGFAIGALIDKHTERQVAEGKKPQNLLELYYKGDQTGSLAAAVLSESNQNLEKKYIICSFHDAPVFRYYFSMLGIKADRVLAPGGIFSARADKHSAQKKRMIIAAESSEQAELMLNKVFPLCKPKYVTPIGEAGRVKLFDVFCN